MAFIVLEAVVVPTVALMGTWLMGTLALWAVAVANLLAVASMAWWVVMDRPELRRALSRQLAAERAARGLSWRAVLVFLVAAACGGTTSPPDEVYLAGAEGAEIHYRVLGTGTDTVVIVHGGPGAGMETELPDWRPLAEHFALVFYDQRGGGRSAGAAAGGRGCGEGCRVGPPGARAFGGRVVPAGHMAGEDLVTAGNPGSPPTSRSSGLARFRPARCPWTPAAAPRRRLAPDLRAAA